jgi:hypothetical protein
MIVASRSQLEAICRQRGYELAAAMACVVSRDGDKWTIDETHASYPRRPGTVLARHVDQAAAGGPGTELKKLLAKIGITATPNCACNARAREMDAKGCEWVEANEATVVGWLRDEAGRRGLPFIDAAGRLLVRRAVANARRQAAAAIV